MDVRFFFTPATKPFLRTALEYLAAFQGAAESVRAVLLCGMPLSLPGLTEPNVAAALAAHIGANYVNVVASPPHFAMGAPLTAADVLPQPDARDAEGFAADTQRAETVGCDVVYTPGTALSQYRVEGHPNIAIVGPLPDELDEAEYDALRRYDAIIAHSGGEAMELMRHKLAGVHVLPRPASIARLLEGVCKS